MLTAERSRPRDPGHHRPSNATWWRILGTSSPSSGGALCNLAIYATAADTRAVVHTPFALRNNVCALMKQTIPALVYEAARHGSDRRPDSVRPPTPPPGTLELPANVVERLQGSGMLPAREHGAVAFDTRPRLPKPNARPLSRGDGGHLYYNAYHSAQGAEPPWHLSGRSSRRGSTLTA